MTTRTAWQNRQTTPQLTKQIRCAVYTRKSTDDGLDQEFNLYLQQQSLLDTVRELNRQGITTKRWATRKRVERGGGPRDEAKLSYMLGNSPVTRPQAPLRLSSGTVPL